MFDIISIGTATRDAFMQSPAFAAKNNGTEKLECLPFGGKVSVEKLVLSTGGGATNAAVTFARQGLKTACVSIIGADGNGREVISELNREGVDISLFQMHHDDLTAYSVILMDPSGERTVLSYKGEGQHFSMQDIPFDKLKTQWLFLSSVGGHLDLLAGVVKYAMEKQIKIAGNPGAKELAIGLEKLAPLLSVYAILSLNREEGAGLTGLPADQPEAIVAALKAVVPGVVLLTDGHNGTLVADPTGQLFSAGVPDSPIVERTGAGDAFVSGFTVEYIRSGDVAKAVQFGTANASSVVTQFGAKAGILKKDEWGPWPLVEVRPHEWDTQKISRHS